MRFYKIRYCYLTVLFNDKGQLLCYNVAVYILNQIEEDHFLIWKAKPLSVQSYEGICKKIDQKGKKLQSKGLF